MPIVQDLSRQEIELSLGEATSRGVPVMLTCRDPAGWHGLHSAILRRSHDRLWLEYPPDVPEALMLSPGLALGLSFKLGHHKHIGNCVLEAVTELGAQGQPAARALCVSAPDRMQRVQRRAFQRVDVPRNRSVLASFCLGSSDQAGPAGPLWEGWVTNLSAGGFQVRLAGRTAPELDEGDLVSVRIQIGQEFKPIVADAQFRHQLTDERGVSFQGFQFVGLNESRRGQEVLGRISRIVCDFQRIQGPHRALDVA